MKTLANNRYLRVYYILIITFVFIFSLYFTYSDSKNHIENSFLVNKNIISESLTSHYSEFVNSKLPEFSLYNGYLDSSSINDFVAPTFKEYDFISQIVYYDTYCVSQKTKNPNDKERLQLECSEILVFSRVGNRYTKTKIKFDEAAPRLQKDLKQVELNFNAFVYNLDHTRLPNSVEISKSFFNFSGNKITYMSVPRVEDLKVYEQMSLGQFVEGQNTRIHQDVISVSMNEDKIKLKNLYPKLYENIKTLPALFVPIMSPDSLYTSITLPGALSEYKLTFISSKSRITKDVWWYFFPLALSISLLYVVMLFIIYLIFRNLRMNEKMFKMQYSFINNLTHEFKTPVGVIKIAGNNLKKEKLVSEQQRLNYAKILEEESEKLNQMINKILSFTQIENRVIQINVDEISLIDFIESTIDLFQVKYPDFEITYEVKEETKIFSDALLLGTIFDNLFENAYKYSPINRKKLHILAHRNKNLISISFIDKGIGIEKTEVDNIFKKFYRVESTYNQNGSVGLGLAFCREVSELLGGEISVKSQLNDGSEFILTIPVKITNEHD